MIDYVIRNARVHGRADTLADIGFENGRIAAVETKLVCDAPEYDAQGCLCCGGLIETHIHLDKSCISDRCSCRTGTLQEAIESVAAAKLGFTEDDIFARGRRTLDLRARGSTLRESL